MTGIFHGTNPNSKLFNEDVVIEIPDKIEERVKPKIDSKKLREAILELKKKNED